MWPYVLMRLGSGAGPASAPVRDWSLANAIASLLEATGEFSEVLTGEEPAPADRGSIGEFTTQAFVDVTDWDETQGFDISEQIHKAIGTVTLVVRGPAKAERKDELDRLAGVTQNTVNGQRLGNYSVPNLTRCQKGRYRNAGGKESHQVVTWEATYLVPGYTGHNTGE